MASKTAICNLALARIGIQQQIASIDESSAYARACKLFYDQSREAILRNRPWPWALRYETLALVVEDPNPDWAYAYRYPDNYLKIYQLVQEGGTLTGIDIYDNLNLGYTPNFSQAIPWQMGSDTQGQLIYTDLASAISYGTYDVTDTAQFSSEFSDALSWRIAAEIAPGLTKDAGVADRAFQMSEMIASRSAASAYNESQPHAPRDSGFTEARY